MIQRIVDGLECEGIGEGGVEQDCVTRFGEYQAVGAGRIVE